MPCNHTKVYRHDRKHTCMQTHNYSYTHSIASCIMLERIHPLATYYRYLYIANYVVKSVNFEAEPNLN